MTVLDEGLSRNALQDLVLPMVSIDEYESKISDKRAIVVGFFVGDEDPANDLSSFIDRSSHPVLDTEVSPAPTIDGQFVVFVELQRDEDFPSTLIDIIKEVDNLCCVEDWTFQCPGHADPVELDEKNLRALLTLDPDQILEMPADEVEDLSEFFRMSAVDSVLIEGRELVLSHLGRDSRFQLASRAHRAPGIVVDSANARWLQNLLGPAYSVYATRDALIVEHNGDQVVLKTA